MNIRYPIYEGVYRILTFLIDNGSSYSFAVVLSKSNVTVISLSLPKLSRTKNFSSERLALVER